MKKLQDILTGRGTIALFAVLFTICISASLLSLATKVELSHHNHQVATQTCEALRDVLETFQKVREESLEYQKAYDRALERVERC